MRGAGTPQAPNGITFLPKRGCLPHSGNGGRTHTRREVSPQTRLCVLRQHRSVCTHWSVVTKTRLGWSGEAMIVADHGSIRDTAWNARPLRREGWVQDWQLIRKTLKLST